MKRRQEPTGTEPNLRKTAVRGSIWDFFGTGLQAVAQVASLAVLARLLDPYEFGVATTAIITVGFLSMLSQLGVSAAIVQKEAVDDHDVATAAWLAIMTGLLLALGLYFATPIINPLLGLSPDAEIITLFSIQLPLLSLGAVPLALLQRRLQFRRIVGIQTSAYLLGVVGVSIVLALLGAGAYSIVWGNLISTCITVAGCIRFAPHKWAVGDFRTFCRSSIALIRFGIPYSLGNLGTWFAGNSDKLVVTNQLGVATLGAYGRAYQLIAAGADLIGGVVDRVLFPALSRIQHDQVRMRNAYVKVSAIVTLASSVGTVTLVWGSTSVVALMLGAGWESTILPLQVLSVALLPRASYKLSNSLVRAVGRVSGLAVRQWVYAALALAGALLGSQWGVAGVAVGTAGAIFIHHAVMLLYANSACPGLLRQMLKLYARCLPPLVVMNLAGFGVNRIAEPLPPAIQLVVLVIGIVGAGGAWMLVFRRAYGEELQLISVLWTEVLPSRLTPNSTKSGKKK